MLFDEKIFSIIIIVIRKINRLDNDDNLCKICGYRFDECFCNDKTNNTEYEDAELGWVIYPEYEDIFPNGHSTIFIALRNTDSVKREISKLQEKFESIKFQTSILKSETNDYLEILLDKQKIAIISRLENCIEVKLLNIKYDQRVRDCLVDTDLDKEKFFGEIKHVEDKIKIKDSGICSQIRTGTLKNESCVEPQSFWNFYFNGKQIGKALIRFHAELSKDCAPTIIMFEVFEDFRRKGLGRKMVKGIEDYMRKSNFSKIRIDNIRAEHFWSNLGYDIKRDDGEKKL